MDVRERVGWNLRRLRVEKGISQDHLAFAAEVERAYVGHLERGKKNPTIVTLHKLATVLDCDVSELFAIPPKDAEPIAPLGAGRRKS
ncbi:MULTISPECIES: helix-turn-helix domain-containing protein [Brucella]|uniref:XRE family transcriptional regulator n=1 Tax=Brucella oryzae TaxID=335286 RepID=A0A2S7J3Z6_9HYPH|nr:MULTISPECIES: helix-turn-helix transcriptional regulator [Brucella]KAB2783175.1 helix-turn-helix transcriptional regulator [Brucella anthropi]KIU70212.1 XRE family transcriptional regulator [Brucella anthropi]MCO7736868.1 helix-turn-helix domain-containing protein [Brucella intermedia]PQA74955.1 XRE family transcriptional regulator [Brucella oryzae]